ncbi:MAG: universal stress protein [Betaproteobacteria bacterium]
MKVLVAIDGSASALRALRYVVEHPGMFGAAPDVILVNVHLPVPSPRAKAVLGHEVVEQYYREEAEESLGPARALLAGTACKVVERAVVGQPPAKILAEAQEHGCEMIVMGTHGHGALGNLLLGSVALRVIAESTLPVLVLK